MQTPRSMCLICLKFREPSKAWQRGLDVNPMPFLMALSIAPFLSASAQTSDKTDDPREALQALKDYMGGWKGSGTSERNKSETWKERANWTWRFPKAEQPFLAVEMPEGKLFKQGELRYLSTRSMYELALTDRKGKQQVFE